MVDNISIEPVELSESQKNAEQLASIWGAVKDIWYGVCYLFDSVAPIMVSTLIMLYAVAAYSNTVSGTITVVDGSASTLLGCGFLWVCLRKVWEQRVTVREEMK